MDFGITIKPDISIDRILSLTQQAESSGFSYAWMFDSHVIWKEPFPLLTLMASRTSRIRLGTCVTNPAVRDVSSRRVLGKRPTTLETLEEFVRVFRNLNAGKTVDLDGVPTRFPWSNGEVPRVWVAGYGPKALRTAGRIGDGVILQFADPDLIEWCLGFVREGAKEAGRDFRKIEVMAAAPVWASDDLPKAREHVRWFPALVSNHVMDLISKYKPEELPPGLTAYVKDRGKYDYHHHCEVGSDNANFVSDEVVDRFCILGPVEDHRKKLDRLRKAGVTQFNIYLMCGEEEETLDVYRHKILPHYKHYAPTS